MAVLCYAFNLHLVLRSDNTVLSTNISCRHILIVVSSRAPAWSSFAANAVEQALETRLAALIRRSPAVRGGFAPCSIA